MTPGRRTLKYEDFEAIERDLDRLSKGCTTVGSWTFGQMCHHLSTVTDRVLSRPADGPHDESLRVGDAARDEVLATGRLPEGIPLPAGVPPPEDVPPAEGVAMMKATLAAMRAAEGPLAPHRLFGPLAMDQWRRLVCIHCAHHLSFAVPDERSGS